MAFIKELNTDFGIPAKYWNIGSYQEDFKNKAAEITLYGYASKEARDQEHQPMAAAKVSLTGDQYVPDRLREELYKTLKTLKDWTDAKDG